MNPACWTSGAVCMFCFFIHVFRSMYHVCEPDAL